MEAASRPTDELIKIIREVIDKSNGESTEERDRIIRKVDDQFEQCDTRIDKYIRSSSKDLTKLIKVFNDIAKKIDVSRANVSNSREALRQCKSMLQSKRDDIRRLWLESCEQKAYFENLAKVKRFYMAGESIRSLCTQKAYVEAAQLIRECRRMLDNEYRDVVGLHEIKRHLDDERIKFERFLSLELGEQLFASVTRAVLESGSSMPSREASFRRRFRLYLVDNSQQQQQQQLSTSVSNTGGGGGASDSAGGGSELSSKVVFIKHNEYSRKSNVSNYAHLITIKLTLTYRFLGRYEADYKLRIRQTFQFKLF